MKGARFTAAVTLCCTLLSFALLSTVPKTGAGTVPETYSAEADAQKLSQREPLSGESVYATASGSKYHLYADCASIADKEIFVSDMIFAGSGGRTLCSLCQTRAAKQEKKEQEKQSEPVQNEDQPLYRTPEGKKYHADRNCRYLKNSDEVTQISFTEASEAGLTPCSACAKQ